MASTSSLEPDKLHDDDNDGHMSSLLARVSKKLGWDKFNTLEDALVEVEAKTPDWKGGKKRTFFGSSDGKESSLSNKENTPCNIPSHKVRSQGTSHKKGSISKTSLSTGNCSGNKKVQSAFLNTQVNKVDTTTSTSNREVPSCSNKPSVSTDPSNSLSQREHSVQNIVGKTSEKEEFVSVVHVRPKLSSVKKKSGTVKGKSQGSSHSKKQSESRSIGKLDQPRQDVSSGNKEDRNSFRGKSGSSPILVSSDSDDFESFVQKMKTPSRPTKASSVHEGLEDFIVDDSDVDSEGEDDVFFPRTPHLPDPAYIISSSSDEDECRNGVIARYRSPKPASGVRKPKKTNSNRKASWRLLSSSSSDEDEPQIPPWKGSTPLWREDTPLRKQVLQKSFLTPQIPPGYKRPTLSVPKVSTSPTPKSKSTSATDKEPSAAYRRNSEPTSFLSSLSTPARGKPPSSPFVADFKKNREDLVKRLFKLYNETVFDNKLPADMSITWNNKMRKTAGFCYTGRSKLNRSTLVARIELSEKVCDSAERVRDTLIHEMCHAATWVLNGVKDGHGRFWQFWARKANHTHPSLPVITRCHTYSINTKFTYQCMECGYRIGRHSKSMDTDRQVCGYCRGRFQLVNKDGTPAKTRAPSKFALFVKERYGTVKKENAGMAHKEVMRLLSAEFATKNKIS